MRVEAIDLVDNGHGREDGVSPAMREYLHTLYQFSERWVVDDSEFRTAFGILATPLDDALATTTKWYHDAGPATRGSHE